MAKGGKRPGAGRPKGKYGQSTLAAIEFRKYVVKRVLEEQEALINAAIKEAKLGNMQALNMLIDRVIGKEPIPLEHDLGGTLADIILKQLSNGSTKKLGHGKASAFGDTK